MTAADPSPARSRTREAAAARTAPLALWRVAEALLATLHALFGAPEEIAARHTLTARAHVQLALWLRAAEAMLRRLLVIEASAYAKPNTRFTAPKRSEGGPLLHAPRPRVRKLMGFDADKPETWRVSFRCFHLPPRCGGSPERREGKGDVARAPCDRFAISSPARGGDKLRFRSAWPLAERYEALIRVFNDPAQYARRLSRRLHATPHRLRETLRAPAEARHRVDQFEAMGEAAAAAWRMHFSSG